MSVLVIPARPDVERGLMKLLRERFVVLRTPTGGRLRVATETPADLPQIVSATVPFVRVSVTGGNSGRTEYRLNFDVDVYSLDRDTSRQLAVDIEAWLMGWPHSTVLDGDYMLLDRVTTTMSPQRVPFEGEVKRFLSSYQISARR